MPTTMPRARQLLRAGFLLSSALTGLAGTVGAQTAPDGSTPDPAIVVMPPATPTTAVDPQNVTGVGQMIQLQQQRGGQFRRGPVSAAR